MSYTIHKKSIKKDLEIEIPPTDYEPTNSLLLGINNEEVDDD